MAGSLNIGLDPLKTFADKLATQVRGKEDESFQNVLKDFMGEVNDLQLNVDKKIDMFASGEIKNVHDVMIAVEEADIAFQLMMEIRNKLMKAFDEVIKMTV